jgi:Sigma-70 region 2
MSIRTESARNEVRPEELEQYRRELTGYCYRMLGSIFDADDGVQETMLRAWRGSDDFEGRSSARFWLRGPANMGRWLLAQGAGCRGSRLVATAANGCAAFGSYRVDPAGGRLPFAVQVIEISGGRITGHHNFVDPELFAPFGLPGHLDP